MNWKLRNITEDHQKLEGHTNQLIDQFTGNSLHIRRLQRSLPNDLVNNYVKWGVNVIDVFRGVFSLSQYTSDYKK